MEKAGLGSKSSDHTADLMMLIKGKEEAAGWTRTASDHSAVWQSLGHQEL